MNKMSKLKTENFREKFFNEKEQYIAFKQSWKDYINAGKAKKHKRVYDEDGAFCMESNLESQHHLLYALLRGQDLSKCFTELSNPVKKANNSFTDYPGFLRAQEALSFANKYKGARMAFLLAPFAGTVTEETVTAVYEEIKNFNP